MPEGRYLQRVLLGQVPRRKLKVSRRKLKVSRAMEAAALWTGGLAAPRGWELLWGRRGNLPPAGTSPLQL